MEIDKKSNENDIKIEYRFDLFEYRTIMISKLDNKDKLFNELNNKTFDDIKKIYAFNDLKSDVNHIKGSIDNNKYYGFEVIGENTIGSLYIFHSNNNITKIVYAFDEKIFKYQIMSILNTVNFVKA